MSQRESPNPPTADAPGAFPDAEDVEDVPLSSDLQSLSRAVKARRAEYTRQRKIRVKIGTWNVAALSGTEAEVGYWFPRRSGRSREISSNIPGRGVQELSARAGNAKKGHKRFEAGSWVDQELVGHGSVQDPAPTGPRAYGEDIDIYVLGLQEIVDVSSPSEALRPYVDPAPSNKWKDAVQEALPEGYKLVSSQQLVGLLLLVFASPSIAPIITSVSSTGVGTGVMGYMGNKGGVATRIVVGGTARLVFINCHLAAGAEKGSLERRNWDASQIASRTKFEPVEEEDDILDNDGNALGNEDFAFWFGDLNYRLDDIPGDDVRHLLHLHTRNEYHAMARSPLANDENANPSSPTKNDNKTDSGRSSSDLRPNNELNEQTISMEDNDIEPLLDPASLETTLASLLPHDQLHQQQRDGKAFHEGWREGDVFFLPTYKYDVGTTGTFDSSEKQRGPSWCDRILFRTRHDYLEFKRKIKEAEDAKKRDEEMRNLGLEQAAEDDSVLFDYDPDLDGTNDYDENEDTNGGTGVPDDDTELKDMIQMESYTSHQEIVSSDHKPLDAEFVLTFDAVDPELKAKIHQEVVRELDKAENEARPGVTVVVENQPEGPNDDQPSTLTEDPNAVNFGQVRYDVPAHRSLTVANTSGVSATFSFHYQPSDDGDSNSVSPPWLHLRVDGTPDGNSQDPKAHPEYTLAPGDTMNVQLILCIYDITFVRELNHGQAKIEDIMVLRVTNGRDYFIPVCATWLPTCFGFSLEELTHMPEEGVRHIDTKTQPLQATDSQNKQGSRLSAPRELFRLTEAIAELSERAIAEWDMIGDNSESDTLPPWKSEQPGWPFEHETWAFTDTRERYHLLSYIRDALDTSAPFAPMFPPELPSRHRVELLAETLISFLKSIRGGIITEPLWKGIEQQMINREKTKSPPLPVDQAQSQILEALSSSPAHSVSFTFLTFMLNRVANEIAPLSNTVSSTPLSPTIPKSTPSLRTPSISETSLSDSIQSTPASPTSSPAPTAPAPTNAISRAFSIRLRKPRNQASISGGVYPGSSSTAQAAEATAKRQAVNKAFAKIFAEAIFSSDVPLPEKDKERRVWEERRRAVVEPFLE
ncbi:hypothetical protein FQN51_002953 [Onygenales sp. PD_10]|nr:hypothetical protein FQN51_002953 [Onygenales sp. PD_10]